MINMKKIKLFLMIKIKLIWTYYLKNNYKN